MKSKKEHIDNMNGNAFSVHESGAKLLKVSQVFSPCQNGKIELPMFLESVSAG